MCKFRGLLAALIAVGALQFANASVIGSLVFIEPSATVSADDAIEVWVRLTLDPLSSALVYLPDEPYPNGVNVDDLPLDGFASIDRISRTVFRNCNETFSAGCDGAGAQYSYDFSTGTERWFDFAGVLDAGDSMDFLLATLEPVDGMSALGTYEIFSVGIGLSLWGTDFDGFTDRADIYRFSTDCPEATCTFTRTVVPIPAAAWLFASGLLGLAGLARSKR